MSIENAGILFSFGLFFLITAIVVTIIWQGFRLARAKHENKANRDYEELARESASAQREVRSELSELRGEVAEIRGRVVAMEKMLREVEG